MYLACRNLGNTDIVLVGSLDLLDQIAHFSARSKSGFSYSGFMSYVPNQGAFWLEIEI